MGLIKQLLTKIVALVLPTGHYGLIYLLKIVSLNISFTEIQPLEGGFSLLD